MRTRGILTLLLLLAAPAWALDYAASSWLELNTLMHRAVTHP